MKQKKTILMLTSWYPDKNSIYSGIFIQEQARAMSRDFNIIVAAIKIDYSRFSPFMNYKIIKTGSSNFIEYQITVFRSFPVYNQFNFFITILKSLNRDLASHHFDLIHCHVSYPAGVAGYYYSKMKKIPFIITEHYGGFTGLFRSIIHKKLLLNALEHANLVTTVSNASKEIMARYIKNEITVVPNLIDVYRFSIKKETDSKINVGFMGGLDTNTKGLDILLTAISEMPNKNIILHIAGAGKLLNTYKQMTKELNISDKCIYYGGIKPENVPTFYNRLDFFILPSRRESFGVVLLEAMASGLPVIATRCGGPEDIVTDETGILVEPENPNLLANGIKELIERKTDFNSEHIRSIAESKFGISSYSKRMQVLYNKIIKAN